MYLHKKSIIINDTSYINEHSTSENHLTNKSQLTEIITTLMPFTLSLLILRVILSPVEYYLQIQGITTFLSIDTEVILSIIKVLIYLVCNVTRIFILVHLSLDILYILSKGDMQELSIKDRYRPTELMTAIRGNPEFFLPFLNLRLKAIIFIVLTSIVNMMFPTQGGL